MTNAIAGIGLRFQVGDGQTPETFTDVAEVKDFTGPSVTQETEDVTHHGSPGNWRERIPTLLDGGEISFTLNYIPTDSTHDATDGLLSDLEAQTAARNFKVTWPDTNQTLWEMSGIVTNFEPQGPVDGAFEAEVTIEVTGQMTLN